MKHWLILNSSGAQHRKELDVNYDSFGYLTLILFLHYLAKCVAVWPLTKNPKSLNVSRSYSKNKGGTSLIF